MKVAKYTEKPCPARPRDNRRSGTRQQTANAPGSGWKCSFSHCNVYSIANLAFKSSSRASRTKIPHDAPAERVPAAADRISQSVNAVRLAFVELARNSLVLTMQE